MISGSNQGVRARLRSLARALLPRPLRDRIRLAGEFAKDAATRIELAARGPAPRRVAGLLPGRDILIVDDLVPDPLFGFGFPRMFEIVQSLARAGHRVSVYPMASTPAEVERVTALCSGDVRVHHGAGVRPLRRLLWREGRAFDLILVSRPASMNAFTTARPAGLSALVVYDLEAVTTPREARRRRLFGEAWTAGEEEAALVAELDVARGADAAAVVTEADGAVIAERLGLPTFVVSHPVAAGFSGTGFANRRDFLFVGRMTGNAARYPNVDAVCWFVREVMPSLDALIGDGYRVHLVGLFDSEAAALASDRVQLHGAVEDLDPFYDGCRVFVAPTRYAAGLPVKVVETIGRGLPCVTTPLLAGQVGARGHGFASDPSARTFAEACALLYANERAWDDARSYGVTLARDRFSQAVFDATLETLAAGAPGMERSKRDAV